MRLRAALVALISACCLAPAGVAAAGADPLADVTGGLSDAAVNGDAPTVPPVELPDTGIGPVDDVVHTVNATVAEATDTVNDVTERLGDGDVAEPATPPETRPADTGGDPTGQPETAAPTQTTPGGASSSSPNPGASDPGAQPAAVASGGGGPIALPVTALGAGDPTPSAAPSEVPATTPSPFVAAFERLPMSLFALIAALAAIGLLMSGRSATRARINRVLRKQRGELQEDVGVLQSALLPAIPSRIGETDLAVAYAPAEGPAAGGDFHDVLTLPEGRIGIVVGDVCGHGREALANTALVHYTVRAYLEAGLEPRESLRLANGALSGKLGETFVAVVAAVYDPASSTLDYATAGHPTPLIAGQPDRAVGALTPPPIGVGLQTGHRQTRISLRPGSRVWFFTDGLIEARDADGEMVSREGLAGVLGKTDGAKPDEIIDMLSEEGGARDDMTAVMLAPADANGTGVTEEEIDINRELVKGDALPRFLAACGLDPAEVERAVDAAERRLRLAGAARMRARKGGLGPRWEVFGASESAAPAKAGQDGSDATTAELAATSS